MPVLANDWATGVPEGLIKRSLFWKTRASRWPTVCHCSMYTGDGTPVGDRMQRIKGLLNGLNDGLIAGLSDGLIVEPVGLPYPELRPNWLTGSPHEGGNEKGGGDCMLWKPVGLLAVLASWNTRAMLLTCASHAMHRTGCVDATADAVPAAGDVGCDISTAPAIGDDVDLTAMPGLALPHVNGEATAPGDRNATLLENGCDGSPRWHNDKIPFCVSIVVGSVMARKRKRDGGAAAAGDI